MITKVRKIGNSYGVLLNKKLMEQINIKDEVSLSVMDNKIVIEPISSNPREGWEEMFLQAGALDDNENFFENVENQFDKEEWTW